MRLVVDQADRSGKTRLAQRCRDLVAAMAQTFLSTDGDIKAVLRTMFNSTEFWSPVYYRKKVKTPLEFVASALRATGAQVQNPGALVQAINKMGMPLYQKQPPTGYSTRAETWMNSDALLERLNFAITLTTGGLGGVNCDPLRVLALGLMARSPREEVVRVNTSGGTEAAVTLVEDALIGGALSLAAIIFLVYREGATGQTPGKRIVGIRLLKEQDGSTLGFGLALGRRFAHALDSFACFIGWLWPLWDPKNQTFADKLVRSVVIKDQG